MRLSSDGNIVAASVAWWPKVSPKIEVLSKSGIHTRFRRRSLTVKIWQKIRGETGPASNEFAWALRQKPDLTIISQSNYFEGLEWMKFCRDAHLAFIPIVHWNSEFAWPADQMMAELVKVYREAKKIYCVSRRNLELLERQLGESLPNAEVVLNPFNVAVDTPPNWPAEDGVLKFANVGRLSPSAKGQDLLLEILSRPRWRNRSVEINLYGQGPCEQGLRRLAAYFQLENVHFRGHVPDVRKIWQENHLLTMPSRAEGLPITLVESMWCARPAVVSDVGGNAEMCLDGETGFVAAAPTANLFEEALERAWNHRGDWQKMGSAARARAERLIPQDTIGEFCRKIESCVGMAKSHGSQDLGTG